MYRICNLILCMLLACPSAIAAGYDVENIQVSTQAPDAVKARDQAIIQAQRQGLAVLVGRPVDKIAAIDDATIARLVNNFSVQGERMTAKSYAANFIIRFDPNRTQMFIQNHGFDLVEQTPEDTSAEAIETAPVQNLDIVVLPVLDIGARRVLWDEPNPWRDTWQRTDHSVKGLTIRVPVGDISDIADIPDAGLLIGKPANAADMLSRYSARILYIIVAKNQGAALDPSGGMALSVYRHDGAGLKFIKKIILHPRPGHAFQDAISPAVQIIAAHENGTVEDEGSESDNVVIDNVTPTSVEPVVTETTAPLPPVVDQSIVITVPYQSLGQWVNIQKRLRYISGLKNVIPIRVSPSSAQIQIFSDLAPNELAERLRNGGFQFQMLPTGENILIER